MRSLIFLLMVSSMLGTVSAQEAEVDYTWSVTTAIKSGSTENVTCTVVFPNEGQNPRLRAIVERNSGQLGSVRLETRGVSEPTTEAGAFEVAALTIGKAIHEDAVETSWRASNEGSLRFLPKTPTNSLLEAMAKSNQLSIVVGVTKHDYSLVGSYRAINALRNCLTS